MMRRAAWILSGLLWARAHAQTTYQMPDMNDDPIITHILIDQLEQQTGGRGLPQFHYEAQGWSGTDENKLWIKSEGSVAGGTFTDGQHDFLYDHAVSPFFDLQAGIRTDADNGTARQWAAIGVQGLAPYFLDAEATFYVGEQGRLAFRTRDSTDWLMTNRLILTPEIEANFENKPDFSRQTRAGLATLDAGLRLRYEFIREFAPYVGVSYHLGRNFGVIAQPGNGFRLTLGLHLWY